MSNEIVINSDKKKPYIAFLDLIGTKGTCDDPKTYFFNINTFETRIVELSVLLEKEDGNSGKVSFFSDSAYVQTDDLTSMLNFLVQLRDRLIADEMFFAAAVKKGDLDVHPVAQPSQSGHDLVFGTSFRGSAIADLYMTQTKFKGIGIFLDSSLDDDIKKITQYKFNKCIYIEYDKDGKCKPVRYTDVALNDNGRTSYRRSVEAIIRIAYSSYIRSKKYGSYYISILSNIIRSCEDKYAWDSDLSYFKNAPDGFKLIYTLFKKEDCYNEFMDFPGLEYLIFVLLDEIYNSKCLNEDEKKCIIHAMVEFGCIKKYWLHSLNDIPDGIFYVDKDKNVNNRIQFIDHCKEYMFNKIGEQL